MELIIKHTNVLTRNYDALLNDKIRFVVNQGSTRSSKTYSLCQMVVIYCLNNPGKIVSIVRKSFPSLRSTVMRDMIDILIEMKIYTEANHIKSENIYVMPNGSKIEFFSLDDAQKVRGRKRDVLWCNEANELSFEEYNQLNFRTSEKLFFDFNPSDTEHWLYNILEKEDAILIHSTYKDNTFLPDSLVKEIEDLINIDQDYYNIYALGLPSKSTHTIYNHQIKYIEELDRYDETIYGLDFGYKHPTALIECNFREDIVYCKEVIYETHLTSEDLIIKMKALNISKSTKIICDYARPEIIEDLRREGYNCLNAIKNVKEGIDAVKSYKVFYHHESTGLSNEFRNYKWQSKGERLLDEPVKLFDDALDACFVGETLITTDKGPIKMEDIKVGDMVLTTKGYKKVLIKHNNGLKPIKNYWMKGDTFNIYLSSTKEHKVKTDMTWTEISQLQSGMTLTLHKPSMVNYTDYIQEEDTSCNINTTCITKYGSSIMELEEKDIIYTTSMETLGITGLKTLKRLKHSNTYQNMLKIGQKNIRRSFKKQVLKLQKNGMVVKKEKYGIRNMVRKHGKVESMLKRYVKNVKENMKQEIQVYQNSAIITAKLLMVEELENLNGEYPIHSDIRQVYDLTVEDQHEYFANGLLVHNCRYAILFHKKNNRKSGGYDFVSF